MLLRRSAQPFDDGDELSRERALVAENLDALGRKGRGLLIDSRLAPHSTEDRLKDEFLRLRDEVVRDFERVAVLVRSKVGLLQVRRLAVEHTVPVHAFDDEAAAIAYLLGGSPP